MRLVEVPALAVSAQRGVDPARQPVGVLVAIPDQSPFGAEDDAFAAAVRERARRREPIALREARRQKRQIRAHGDDARVARANHERRDRRPGREVVRVVAHGAIAPVLDDGERAVLPVQNRHAGGACNRAHVVRRRRDSHAEPPRARGERGVRSGRYHDPAKGVQRRVADVGGVDRIAGDPARAADRERRFQQRGGMVRIVAPVVEHRDVGDPVRFRKRGSVERERAKHRRGGREARLLVELESQRRVPRVERV
ncbi:MAG TPA: hypothetical protein VGU66_19710 [Candidatus Elarobacter sp.]|nr:hypothetical protein [Candidatus Elarobacter sp.]